MRKLKGKLIISIVLVFFIVIPSIQSNESLNPNYHFSELGSSLPNNSSWVYSWSNDMWSSRGVVSDAQENVYCLVESRVAEGYYFLSKINNTGNEEWTIINITRKNSDYLGMVIDSIANVYALWYHYSYYNTTTSLIKINSSGHITWTQTFKIFANKIYLDENDNIYITGTFDDYLKLIKFNKFGIIEINNSILMHDDYNIGALFVDNLNCSYIAGISSSEGGSGGYEFTPYICLWRLNSSGEILSFKEWDMSPYHIFYNMLFDDLCNLYLIATDDSFSVNKLFKYNSSGELIQTITWKSPIIEYSIELWNKIVIDSFRNIYCTGDNYFYLTKPYYKIYIVKFDENGTLLENGAWKIYDTAQCNDIYIDIKDNLYLAGSYGYFPTYHAFLVKNPVLSELSDPIFYFNLDQDTLFTLILLSIVFGIWSLLGIVFYLHFIKKYARK